MAKNSYFFCPCWVFPLCVLKISMDPDACLLCTIQRLFRRKSNTGGPLSLPYLCTLPGLPLLPVPTLCLCPSFLLPSFYSLPVPFPFLTLPCSLVPYLPHSLSLPLSSFPHLSLSLSTSFFPVYLMAVPHRGKTNTDKINRNF